MQRRCDRIRCVPSARYVKDFTAGAASTDVKGVGLERGFGRAARACRFAPLRSVCLHLPG